MMLPDVSPIASYVSAGDLAYNSDLPPMKEGTRRTLVIPSELGYGDRGSGAKIGGGDVLIFTIEILKIKGGKKPVA